MGGCLLIIIRRPVKSRRNFADNHKEAPEIWGAVC